MTRQERDKLSASDCEHIRSAPAPAIAVCAGDEGATAPMTRRLAAAARSLVPERGNLPMLDVLAVDRPLLSGAAEEELDCAYSEVPLYYDVVFVDPGLPHAGFSGPAFAAGAVEIPKTRDWNLSPRWDAALAGEWPPEAQRLEGPPAVFARDLYSRALGEARSPDDAADRKEPS